MAKRAPRARSEAEHLATSHRALGEFLAERFGNAFLRKVDEGMFEAFPDRSVRDALRERAEFDGIQCLGRQASALADAGVDVDVVVCPSSDRLETVPR